MKGKPTRVDKEFAEDMSKIARIRLSKGLAKFRAKDLGTAEMTKLLRRTQGYQISLDELSKLPRKEDVK